MLWCGLGRPVITSEIGYWSVFVFLGWRFVFGIIMKRDGREPTSSDAMTTLGIIKLFLSYEIGRPARGYSLSPPGHLTNGVVDRPWVVGREFGPHVHYENAFKRKVNFLMSRIS